MKRKCERETERRKKEWQQRCILTEFSLKNNEWGGGLFTVVFAVELISDQLSSSMCARSECECVWGSVLCTKIKLSFTSQQPRPSQSHQIKWETSPPSELVTTISPKGTLPYFCSSVSYHYPLRDCQGVLSLLLLYAIEYMRHIGNSLVNRTCLWSVLGNVCVVSLTLVRGEIWLVSSW